MLLDAIINPNEQEKFYCTGEKEYEGKSKII
jgi:hypothetical protein